LRHIELQIDVHQDVVVKRVLPHRRRGIPLDAVILACHWEAGYHNLRWRDMASVNPGGGVARWVAVG